MEIKTFNLEVKAFDKMTGEFEGFANTKDIDLVDDIVEPSAFKKTIKESKKRAIFFMHAVRDIMQLLGVAKDLKVKEDGLFIKGQLDMDSESGKKAAKAMDMGSITEMSIGFRIIKADMKEIGKKFIRVIKELSLHEISLIPPTMAANPNALITSFKSNDEVLIFIKENKDNIEFKEKVFSLLGFIEPDVKSTQESDYTTQITEEPNRLDVEYMSKKIKEWR